MLDWRHDKETQTIKLWRISQKTHKKNHYFAAVFPVNKGCAFIGDEHYKQHTWNSTIYNKTYLLFFGLSTFGLGE